MLTWILQKNVSQSHFLQIQGQVTLAALSWYKTANIMLLLAWYFDAWKVSSQSIQSE